MKINFLQLCCYFLLPLGTNHAVVSCPDDWLDYKLKLVARIVTRQHFPKYFVTNGNDKFKECNPKSKKQKELLQGTSFVSRFVKSSYLKPDENKPCSYPCITSSNGLVVHKSILTKTDTEMKKHFLIPSICDSVLKLIFLRFFVL